MSLHPTDLHIHAWTRVTRKHMHPQTDMEGECTKLKAAQWKTNPPCISFLSHRLKTDSLPTADPALSYIHIQFCLYIIFTLNSFPESPPSFELDKCRCTLLDQQANLNKFEQASEDCRGTDEGERRQRRGKVSQSGGWARALCWFLLSLCEVSGRLLPRYLSSLAKWEGSWESGWMREAYH